MSAELRDVLIEEYYHPILTRYGDKGREMGYGIMDVRFAAIHMYVIVDIGLCKLCDSVSNTSSIRNPTNSAKGLEAPLRAQR